MPKLELNQIEPYLEKPSIDKLIASLEKALTSAKACFLDANVVPHITKHVDYDGTQNLDALVLKNSARLTRTLAKFMVQFDNIYVVDGVAGELQRAQVISSERLSSAIDRYRRLWDGTESELEDDPVWSLLHRNQFALRTLGTALERVRYSLNPDYQPVFDEVLEIVKYLDNKFKIKKPFSKSDVDEHLVAAVYTHALLFKVPVRVVSRDMDVKGLVEATGTMLAFPSIARKVRSHSMRVKCIWYNAAENVYEESKKCFVFDYENAKEHVNSSLAKILDLLPEEQQSDKIEDAPDIEDDFKPKRFTIANRSFNTAPNYNRLRGRRHRERYIPHRVAFSNRFKREFGHLLINQETRFREPKPKGVKIPSGVSHYIGEMGFKYGEVDNPSGSFGYGVHFAKFFVENSGWFKERDVKPEEFGRYCKNFVEYAFFLRSLHGDKEVPVTFDGFARVLNPQGKLDSRLMGDEVGDSFRDFGEERGFGDFEGVVPRFDRFMMYVASTKYADQTNNPVLMLAGRAAFQEACEKYNINEGNVNNFLKLALQHIEWGMRRAYIQTKQGRLEKPAEVVS